MRSRACKGNEAFFFSQENNQEKNFLETNCKRRGTSFFFFRQGLNYLLFFHALGIELSNLGGVIA